MMHNYAATNVLLLLIAQYFNATYASYILYKGYSYNDFNYVCMHVRMYICIYIYVRKPIM